MNEWLSKVNWADLAIDFGTTLIKLVAILIIFLIVRSLGKRVIRKMFKQVQEKSQIDRSKTLEKLMINIFSYVILFIFVGIVFQLFGFDIKTLIAGAGVVGLAIGFGAQGLVSDVVTGFFILLEKQIDVGDYVTIGSVEGIVEEVNLRNLHVRAFDGTLIYVPNREISIVENHSRGNMQALVDIGISYDADIDEAIQVIQAACDQVSANNDAIKEGPNVLGVLSLGSSDVVIRVLCKTANMEQWGVERQLRKAIKEALQKNNIEIPYPHQVNIQK